MDKVEQYLAIFEAAVDTENDSPEEDEALQEMDALWQSMVDKERVYLKSLLVRRIRSMSTWEPAPDRRPN